MRLMEEGSLMEKLCQEYGIIQEDDETVDPEDVEGEWADVK